MDLERHSEASLDVSLLERAWAEHARTPMGAARIVGFAPLLDVRAVQEVYAQVTAWRGLEEAGAAPSLAGAIDVGALALRARKGEVFEGETLVRIGYTLDLLDRVAAALCTEDAPPELAEIAAEIAFDRSLLDMLGSAFEPDGRLSDRAHPALGELRQAVLTLHTTLRSTLETMVRGSTYADDLQDRFWTIRNDRYVLPLKPHAKRRGVVHGTSGSGKTVFVEPHEVLELNNRLRLAEGALEAEERRILRTLSREVGAHADELVASTEALVRLDLIASRASLMEQLGACPVRTGTDGVIAVRDLRHPVLVLRGLEVVGHSVQLGPERPALVLTGPNTGGKTVALKALGLCAWMVQRGLGLPCDPNSRFDLFTEVLADVGDAQDVEGGLSSFSAQLVVVRAMLERAGPGRLFLLDELASGTDPGQGGALAVAVVERLLDAGARVVCTTHLPALKALADTDPRVQVAAMQLVDGRPTYRLEPGRTGASHALATAERLGIDRVVLERAREHWRGGDGGLGEALESIEAQRSALEALRSALAERERVLEAREADLAERERQLEEQRRAQIEEAGAAFRRRLRAAEEAIGAIVAELQRAPSQRGVRAARASLDALRGLLPAEAPQRPVPSRRRIAVGDRVRHPTLGVGQVEAVGKTIKVRRGALSFTARPGDLEPLEPVEPPKVGRRRPVVPSRRSSVALADAVRLPSNTLDLRGMRVDEALDAVDKGLDRAVLAGQDVLFVLHGHGTGALKQAVRRSLGSHPAVARYMPAKADQGGDAFTVVALRD